MAVLSISALLIGGGLSLAASSHPDGLEWSIGQVTGSTELGADAGEDSAYAVAGQIQESTALLPDYAFQGSESAWGTTVSGIAGSAAVLAVCVAFCYGLRFWRRRKHG